MSSGDENALGYFGFAVLRAEHGRLKLVAIDDGDDTNGKGPIAPSPETVKNGTYRPLSRPIFIYPKVKALDRAEVQGLRRLLSHQGHPAHPRGRVHPAGGTGIQHGAQPVHRTQDWIDVRRASTVTAR